MEKAKLRFYAKGSGSVSLPGFQGHIGQMPIMVGRKYDPEKGNWPATKDPFECDTDSTVGRRLARLTRIDDALWPADEATAVACGVPFVETEWRDGVIVPVTKGAKKTEQSSKGSG